MVTNSNVAMDVHHGDFESLLSALAENGDLERNAS